MPDGCSLDAVELEIRWQRLISLLAEAALTVVKTSFSKIVSEGGDFGCLLYDRQGRMIAQDAGISSKLAPSPRTVLSVIERYPPERLRPSDVFITNDPWLCCGHLYDISLIKPFFHEGRLLGFGECLAHVPDIGGSLTNDSHEVYEEGICLPVMRLLSGGDDVEEIWSVIRANVRVPNQLEGDIRAFISALQLGERRVVAFLRDYRLTDLQNLADQIIARSEAAIRRSIRENIPPGVYRNRIVLDGLESGTPLSMEVAIQADRDGTITIDYSGTDPQSEVGINCTEVYTHAWTLYSIRCIVAPSIPYNDGLFRPVRMLAPQGSFLNVRHPAPVRMKSSTGNFIPFAIFGALAEIVPERVIAESGIKCVIRCFATSEDGRALAETPHFMGGIGARWSKDGVCCMSFPAAGAEMPIEMLENALPVTVLSKSLVADSGGAGRFRGGLGQRLRLRNESARPMKLLVQNMKVHTPAKGYAGGHDAAHGGNNFRGRELPGKTTVLLSQGEVIDIRLSGGGGMFDPMTRPVERVLDDIRAGLVTPGQAGGVYGVILDEAGGLDAAATARLRATAAAPDGRAH
jgi:N-methylhydantoinase B